MPEKRVDSWTLWEQCEGGQGAEALLRLADELPELFANSTLISSRWSRLPFYAAHRLMQLQFARDRRVGRAFVLHGPERTWWLNGNPDPMYDVNEAESLALTQATVCDYIRFFFYFLRADSGAFVLIESVGEIRPEEVYPGGWDESQDEVPALVAARNRVRPLLLRGIDATGRWLVDATAAHDGTLFNASLAVEAGGGVEMVSNEPIMALDALEVRKVPSLDSEVTAGESPSGDDALPVASMPAAFDAEPTAATEDADNEIFVLGDDGDELPTAQIAVTDATAYSVTDYLKQIGKVPLLNAEQEVELAKRIEAGLDVIPEKVVEVQEYGREPISLHTPLGEDGDTEFGDLMEDSEAIVRPEAVSFTLLQEQLHSLLDTLSEREAGVVSMRFGLTDGQPKTLDEIGKIYGVTRERIRQIESKTMKKLLQPAGERSVGHGRRSSRGNGKPRIAAQLQAEPGAAGNADRIAASAVTGDAAPGLNDDGKPSNRSERFLVARLPARAPQSAELSLLVRVTTSARESREEASMSLPGLDVGPAGTRVTIVVQAPHDLVPLGELEQVIVVPVTGDSQPVRFPFRALGSGLQRVLVTAWAGGTFLGELALEVSVQENAPYVDGLERAAPVGALRAKPGEVTLQVRFDGKQYTFQLLSGEYLFDPVAAEAVTAHPGEPLERMIATLRAMAAGSGGGYSAANARKWMERAGMGLWNDMVPDLIKDQFWRLRGSVSAFSIAVGRDVMPWELLYPLAQGCDEGFLVEQFPVMRRVYGQQRSHRIITGNARYVVPGGSPDNALDEIAAIRQILGSRDAGDREIGDLDVLLEHIESGQMGLLHFACHNTFAADSGGSAIGMDGGPFVPLLLKKAVTLQALAGRNPLVFINACRTAGAVPEYTQMIGWAEQFMAAGAGAFVGTLWAVRSNSATKFAEAFYSALAGGSPLGQASQLARLEVAHDRSDPTWLAYSVYGDPSAHATTS